MQTRLENIPSQKLQNPFGIVFSFIMQYASVVSYIVIAENVKKKKKKKKAKVLIIENEKFSHSLTP